MATVLIPMAGLCPLLDNSDCYGWLIFLVGPRSKRKCSFTIQYDQYVCPGRSEIK